MAAHGNLADPSYEPTDEELQELSRSAFQNVAKQHEEALSRLRAEIAKLSAEARAHFKGKLREQGS